MGSFCFNYSYLVLPFFFPCSVCLHPASQRHVWSDVENAILKTLKSGHPMLAILNHDFHYLLYHSFMTL